MLELQDAVNYLRLHLLSGIDVGFQQLKGTAKVFFDAVYLISGQIEPRFVEVVLKVLLSHFEDTFLAKENVDSPHLKCASLRQLRHYSTDECSSSLLVELIHEHRHQEPTNALPQFLVSALEVSEAEGHEFVLNFWRVE